MGWDNPPVPPEFEDQVRKLHARARTNAITQWAVALSLGVTTLSVLSTLRHTSLTHWVFIWGARVWLVGSASLVFVLLVRAIRASASLRLWSERVKRIREARCSWCGYSRDGLLSWDGCPECGREPRLDEDGDAG